MRDRWTWPLWLRASGTFDPSEGGHMPDIDSLRKSEWSEQFETLMRNRLLMGAFRYGRIHAEGKPQYDRIGSARKRLDLYEKTGNLEHLVDVANIMLMEFEEGRHPQRHLRSADDGIHTEAHT